MLWSLRMTPPLILVTETEAAQQQAIRMHLEESGFRVMPSGGATQIFQALATMPVGVIVLDAALRGPDGMDLCRDVRARSEVPVILVGANSSEVDRVVALELGADDYINKPYSARELAARLRAVLRRGRSVRAVGLPRQTKAAFDGWTVDFGRRSLVNPSGEPVNLTAAEFALLAVLLDHPQMVIARARLMELAGVRDTPSSDRSIDVLISRLRRKLRYGDQPAPIVTVRRVGYMFSAAVERHS